MIPADFILLYDIDTIFYYVIMVTWYGLEMLLFSYYQFHN